MRLGLGLSICDVRGSAASVYDPAVRNLSVWLRTAYGGAPWEGTASAGGSGGRDFTDATNPATVGATLNGRATADFQTNRRLSNGSSPTDVWGAGSYSCLVVFRARTAAAASGFVFADPGLLTPGGDATGGCVISFSDAGVRAAHYDGAWNTIAKAASVASWHATIVTFDGSAQKLWVDDFADSSEESQAKNAIAPLSPANVRVGCSYDQSVFLDGLVAEVMVEPGVAWDEAARLELLSYIQAYHRILT